MILPAVIEQVKSHLADGKLSQRKIAALTGVSRGTVGAIAAGKRSDCDAVPSNPEDPFEQSAEPPQQCPGCGGTVLMPCRLCGVRRLIAEARVTRQPPELEDPLKLELVGADRRRYEQVRSRRSRLRLSNREN